MTPGPGTIEAEEGDEMARIIGIGGVFFRSDDPARLSAWYEKHLGLRRSPGGDVLFPWREAGDGQKEQMTVWALFPKDTNYFGPSKPAFMVNYIVDDLDGMLVDLRAAGAQVEDRQESEYGRFAWVTDPEGNRIELWQPPNRPAS
jgi:predicted enzyme related to lactoylglutathione lyase